MGDWRPYYAQVIGYYPGLDAHYYLQGSTCQLNSDPHMFLLLLSHQASANETNNINALYCKIKYQAVSAEVVVEVESRLVKNVTYLAPPTEINPDQVNGTLFENILSGGTFGERLDDIGPFGIAPHHATKTRKINSMMANSD
ncbi:hypothetical protein ABW20_dc0108566 [Dactylellina cionopaga]|nr:hypothetical protein ABW20_dc0108566 [Dactylellina cionopaga]